MFFAKIVHRNRNWLDRFVYAEFSFIKALKIAKNVSCVLRKAAVKTKNMAVRETAGIVRIVSVEESQSINSSIARNISSIAVCSCLHTKTNNSFNPKPSLEKTKNIKRKTAKKMAYSGVFFNEKCSLFVKMTYCGLTKLLKRTKAPQKVVE